MINSYYQVVLPLQKKCAYSPSLQLFYHPSTNPEMYPEDYVMLSQEEAELIAEQNNSEQ